MSAALAAEGTDQAIAVTIVQWTFYGLACLVALGLALWIIVGIVTSPGVLIWIPIGAIVIGFIGTAIFGHWQTCALVGAIAGGVLAAFAAMEG